MHLARALRDQTVKPWHVLIYSLFFVGAVSVAVFILPAERLDRTTPLWLENIATWGGFFVSLVLAWAINRQGDNQSFLKRYLSLDFPISLRTYALVLILSLAAVPLDARVNGTSFATDEIPERAPFGYAAIVIANVYFCYAMAKGFKVAAGSSDPKVHS